MSISIRESMLDFHANTVRYVDVSTETCTAASTISEDIPEDLVLLPEPHVAVGIQVLGLQSSEDNLLGSVVGILIKIYRPGHASFSECPFAWSLGEDAGILSGTVLLWLGPPGSSLKFIFPSSPKLSEGSQAGRLYRHAQSCLRKLGSSDTQPDVIVAPRQS